MQTQSSSSKPSQVPANPAVSSQSSVCSASQEHLAPLIFPLYGNTFFTWLLEHHTHSVFFLLQCSSFFISSSSQSLSLEFSRALTLSPHIFCICPPELTCSGDRKDPVHPDDSHNLHLQPCFPRNTASDGTDISTGSPEATNPFTNAWSPLQTTDLLLLQLSSSWWKHSIIWTCEIKLGF